MEALLFLGLLFLLSRSRGQGSLNQQPTGPDALANLQHQNIRMSQLGTRDRTQTAFPVEWWVGPAPDHSGSKINLVWASDDPSSWAAYAVHRSPELATELARGRGPLTGAVESALNRRML